jgi:hypothetical protein
VILFFKEIERAAYSAQQGDFANTPLTLPWGLVAASMPQKVVRRA